MDIKFTPKQVEILNVVRMRNKALKPCTIYDILDDLNYGTERTALLHSVRRLVGAGYLIRDYLECRRRHFAVTNKTLDILG